MVNLFKKLIILFLFLFCTSLPVIADTWEDNFKNIYALTNICPAVKNAFTNGADPKSVIEEAVKYEDLDEVALVSCLYCTGVPYTTISKIASNNGISKQNIVLGFRDAINKCKKFSMYKKTYTDYTSYSSNSVF